jgi:hypothetical protein
MLKYNFFVMGSGPCTASLLMSERPTIYTSYLPSAAAPTWTPVRTTADVENQLSGSCQVGKLIIESISHSQSWIGRLYKINLPMLLLIVNSLW